MDTQQVTSVSPTPTAMPPPDFSLETLQHPAPQSPTSVQSNAELLARLTLPRKMFYMSTVFEPIVPNMRLLNALALIIVVGYWILLTALTTTNYINQDGQTIRYIEASRHLEQEGFNCSRLGRPEFLENAKFINVSVPPLVFDNGKFGGANITYLYYNSLMTNWNRHQDCLSHWMNCENYKSFKVRGLKIGLDLQSDDGRTIIWLSTTYEKNALPYNGNVFPLLCPYLKDAIATVFCEPLESDDAYGPFSCEKVIPNKSFISAYGLAANSSGFIFSISLSLAVLILFTWSFLKGFQSRTLNFESAVRILVPIEFFDFRISTNLFVNTSKWSLLFIFVSLFQVGIIAFLLHWYQSQSSVSNSFSMQNQTSSDKSCQRLQGISNPFSFWECFLHFRYHG